MATIDLNKEVCVVHVAFFISKMSIYLASPISKTLIYPVRECQIILLNLEKDFQLNIQITPTL